MNTIPKIQPVTYKAHRFQPPSHKPRVPITITNFHYVDDTLMRGAKPTQAQLQELKDNGVKTIISFCTNYNPQNPKAKTLPNEAFWAKNLGINFYWMPFRSNQNPHEKDIKTFFKVVDDAKAKGEKVFIHCRHVS